jgi:hypothetical protein
MFVRLLRVIFACLLLTGAVQAMPAPSFKKLSIEQISAQFSGRTFMMHDRKLGTVVIYFSKNRKVYTFGTLFRKVEKTDWSVLQTSDQTAICFKNAILSRAVRGGVNLCMPAKDIFKGSHDATAGDVLGLSKRGKPRIVLDGKKTSFVKLLGK